MNIAELTVMSMFDILEYIIISKKLIYNNESSYKIKSKILFCIYTLGFASMISISNNLSDDKYNIIITPALAMVMTYLLYRRKIKDTIYIYGITATIILAVQFCVVSLIYTIGVEIQRSFTEGLIVHIITLNMIIAISKHLPIYTIFNYVNKDNKIFKFLVLNMFVILASILIYWYIDIDGILKELIVVTTLSTGIILVNFVLLKNGLKNELEEKQLKIYEEYLPVIDELINQLRRKQHEFDNHIQALKMITITSKNYDDIINSMKKYISDLESDNDLGDLIKIDNKILAGFLYNKVKSAEKLGIKFIIDIEEYNFKLKLKDYELIEIVGTLINNAFETGVENNEVVITLSKEKDVNVIGVKNKHPHLNKNTIDKIFNKGFSTKSRNNRGYGLYNLKQIVEKYNGNIEVLNKSYCNENYIVFRILFNRD